jgi:hypothetical protein
MSLIVFLSSLSLSWMRLIVCAAQHAHSTAQHSTHSTARTAQHAHSTHTARTQHAQHAARSARRLTVCRSREGTA